MLSDPAPHPVRVRGGNEVLELYHRQHRQAIELGHKFIHSCTVDSGVSRNDAIAAAEIEYQPSRSVAFGPWRSFLLAVSVSQNSSGPLLFPTLGPRPFCVPLWGLAPCELCCVCLPLQG